MFHKNFKHKRGFGREHSFKKVTKKINVIYSSFGEALFMMLPIVVKFPILDVGESPGYASERCEFCKISKNTFLQNTSGWLNSVACVPH